MYLYYSLLLQKARSAGHDEIGCTDVQKRFTVGIEEQIPQHWVWRATAIEHHMSTEELANPIWTRVSPCSPHPI